jgi:hypothetical protein
MNSDGTGGYWEKDDSTDSGTWEYTGSDDNSGIWVNDEGTAQGGWASYEDSPMTRFATLTGTWEGANGATGQWMNNTDGTGGIWSNNDYSDQGLWWYNDGDDYSGSWISESDSDKNGTWTTDPADPLRKIGEQMTYDGLWYSKDGENTGIWKYNDGTDGNDGKW